MAEKTGWLQRMFGKAGDALERQQEAVSLGKVAGKSVTDDAGGLIVDAGQTIDEATIARARAAGKLSALAGAAIAAHAQDVKEKLSHEYQKTDTGREAQLLDSVEEYAEAQRYTGRVLSMDITDTRGNVVLAAGTELDADNIRTARDAGLISTLLVVAEQSPAAGARAYEAPIKSAPVNRPQKTLLNDPDE